MADKNEALDILHIPAQDDSESVSSPAEKRNVLDNSPDDESGSYNDVESATSQNSSSPTQENSPQSTSEYKPSIHLIVPNQQSTEIDEILQMTEQLAKDEWLAKDDAHAAQQAPRSSVDSKSIAWLLSSETSLTARAESPSNREYSPREIKNIMKKKLLTRGKSTKHTLTGGKSIKEINRKSVPISIREVGRSWRKKSYKQKLKASGEEKVDWLSSSITSVTATTSESSSWDCSDETDSTTYFEDSLHLDTADARHKERKVMRRRIRHKNYRWQRNHRRASDDLLNALSNELLPLDDDGDESNTDIFEDRPKKLKNSTAVNALSNELLPLDEDGYEESNTDIVEDMTFRRDFGVSSRKSSSAEN